MPDLLWRKREALTADGRVLLDEPAVGRRPTRRRAVQLLPSGQRYARLDDGHSHIIDCAGSFNRFLFSHVLPDIDWLPASGHGVTLDVAPQVRDEGAVLDLLGQLAGLGWSTADARWNIQQSTNNWHGLGAAGLAEELPRWQSRADDPDAHHSEELCYLDRCDGGFYTLTATLAAHKTRRTTGINLSFQLQGVPLDVGPLLQLCRSVGVHDGAHFRPRSGQSITHHRADPVLIVDVRPVAYLTTLEDEIGAADVEWATGIVIANPFRESATDKRRRTVPEGSRSCETASCLFARWHTIIRSTTGRLPITFAASRPRGAPTSWSAAHSQIGIRPRRGSKTHDYAVPSMRICARRTQASPHLRTLLGHGDEHREPITDLERPLRLVGSVHGRRDVRYPDEPGARECDSG